MASGYQHIQNYKGSLYGNLNYSGIEYDYEVPDNLVVASPGGVSGIHHHYTKGIYSDQSSTQDIHAGNGNADGYPYGEYGNVYQLGQSATRFMGDFVEPIDLNEKVGFTQNQSEPKKEYFKYINSPENQTEFIPQPTNSSDMTPITFLDDKERPYKTLSTANVLAVVAIFTVGYIAVNFWVKGGEDFITTRFYKGEVMNWKQYMSIACIFTVVLLVIAYIFGIPLVALEKL